ncbi:sensor histidine kinase [Planotetraspora mira]|uniref:histidine kinase n=1 Tax=Planotetraspora mira TaxID=58121 RepID=A0A8J3TU78_9ACTN|nr:sensor histidine kinase [Planotetraspora mira]GII32349.1 two-component sensor histidine kinase [Planotetraspora mira]
MTGTTGAAGGDGAPVAPGRAVRLAVALVPAALTTVAILTGLAAVGAPIGWGSTVPLALFLGGMLLVRERWPVGVLLFSAAALVAYQGAGLFEGGWIWPMTVACYTVAAAGRMRWAVGVGLLLLAYAVTWDWTAGDPPARALASGGAETLWLALVLAVGNARRSQLLWRAEHAARLAQLKEARELDARRRLAEQRLQISRELHDIVAHTLAVVGVHLNVATDALDESPSEVRDALRTAMEVRAKAMTDLRSLIGILRDGPSGAAAPQPDLAAVADLVAHARATGLDVTLEELGDPARVPAVPAVAAYRVVQEALTNTIKHAAATRVTVRLRYTARAVTVEVRDDGRATGPFTEGHGLTGMRERVAALGGTLTIGPAAPEGSATPGKSVPPEKTDRSWTGGLTVRATIPVGGAAVVTGSGT